MPGPRETPTPAPPLVADVPLALSLRNLIPIGVAIAAGCEPCAARTVARALEEGSPPGDVDRALRIVSGMLETGCFVRAAGADVIARMAKPLDAARKALRC